MRKPGLVPSQHAVAPFALSRSHYRNTRFRTDGSNATVNAGPCTGTIRGLTAEGSKVDLDDQPSTRDTYARGQIQLRTPDAGGSVHASLEIGMDKYLFGLAEVPASWETEALRAQARYHVPKECRSFQMES